MHRTLQVPEILSTIFDRCPPRVLSAYPCKESSSDLAALARTCRAFKEPALDVLWRVLVDLYPLACCLPEASRRVSQGNMVRSCNIHRALFVDRLPYFSSGLVLDHQTTYTD